MGRFNWTDGRLNSSNLVELSGQITEKFDEEFRILYAQSLPLSTPVPPRARTSGAHERLLLLKHTNATSSPHSARDWPAAHMQFLTSTPGRKPRALVPDCQTPCDPLTREAVSDSSVLGDEWAENQQQQQHIDEMPEIQSEPPIAPTPNASSEVATQARCVTVDCGSQTEPGGLGHPNSPHHASDNTVAPSPTTDPTTTTTTTANREPTTIPNPDPAGSPPRGLGPVSPSRRVSDPRSPVVTRDPAADASLRDCFTKLSRERQLHYSSIRSRLESMVSVLSQRRELADVTNVSHTTAAAARPRAQRECGKEQSAGMLPGEHVSVGTWPRARCLH